MKAVDHLQLACIPVTEALDDIFDRYDARLLRTARWPIGAGMAAYEYIESLRKEDE